MDPQAAYEAEQAALRSQHGYDDPAAEDEDAASTFSATEVNPEIWKDMDSILCRGFLHQAAQIGEVSFVFKSLNHHEFERLLVVTRFTSEVSLQRKQYNLLLALGVWLVDGINVLVDREQNLPELLAIFEKMPSQTIQQIVRYMGELNRRANRAILLTEAYAYEHSSRFRWLQVFGLDLTSPAVTGVGGTGVLGLNWGQLVWRALNRLEDLKTEAETQWESSKFLASAMAGSKAISKVNSQDKSRRKNEAQDRQARRDQLIRQALFGEKGAKEDGSRVIQVARTVEELAQQLDRDLRGERDWHDQVIDAFQARIDKQEQDRQDRLVEVRALQSVDMGAQSVYGTTDFRGMSQAEVTNHLAQKRREAQEALARADMPLVAMNEAASNRHERWSNALPLNAVSKGPNQGSDKGSV